MRRAVQTLHRATVTRFDSAKIFTPFAYAMIQKQGNIQQRGTLKMLKMFLILLLVCVAYSPYSLAVNHKLYRRMELGESLKIGRNIPKSASGPSSSGAKSIDQDVTKIRTERIYVPEKNTDHEITVEKPQQNPGHANPNNEVPTPQDTPKSEEVQEFQRIPPQVTARKMKFFKNIRYKFSNFFESIIWHLRNLKRTRFYTPSSSPRIFQEPFKGLDGFKKISDDQQLVSQLKSITNVILKKPHLRSSYLQKDTDLSNLFNALKSSLIKVRAFNHEFEAAKGLLALNSERILNNLKPLLATRKTTREDLSQLGRQLSEYRLETLQADRKLLYEAMNINHKYLANVFGFLGPGNVLSREVKAIIEEGFQAGRWLPAPGVSAESIVLDIEKLQKNVAEYVKWQRKASMDLKFRGHFENLDFNVFLEIQNIEKSLSQKLQPPTTFPDLLESIQKSESYKGFQRELMAPKSDAAYEIQLIEPWGISQTLQSMYIKELPFRSINGILPTLEAWEKLEAQAPIAFLSTRTRLDFTRKAKTVEAQLRQILTPEGMNYVSRQLLKELDKNKQN